jgi:hypothetical protein
VRWDGLVTGHGWSARLWETAVVLRPAWWTLRAWVAVQLLDAALGPSEYPTVLPGLGAPLLGPLLLLAAVWGSVLLGTGRLWPSVLTPLRAWVRVGLLGLNLFAVAMLAVVLGRFPSAGVSHDLANGAAFAQTSAAEGTGLRNNGRFVRNVFAYDSTGNPLTGVQLYDAKGRPLSVTGDRFERRYQVDGTPVWTYPWYNGSQPLLNVFPLPVRGQDSEVISRRAWESARPPELPPAPLAVVPPVALPTSADDATPSSSASSSAGLSAGPSTGPSAAPSAGRSAGPSGGAPGGR